jgi:hypothetical protein
MIPMNRMCEYFEIFRCTSGTAGTLNTEILLVVSPTNPRARNVGVHGEAEKLGIWEGNRMLVVGPSRAARGCSVTSTGKPVCCTGDRA